MQNFWGKLYKFSQSLFLKQEETILGFFPCMYISNSIHEKRINNFFVLPSNLGLVPYLIFYSQKNTFCKFRLEYF